MGEVISYTKAGIEALIDAALSGAATQADIDAAIAALVDTAPGTLDTLNELAAALGDDANFAATMATQLGDLDTRVDTLESAPPPASGLDMDPIVGGEATGGAVTYIDGHTVAAPNTAGSITLNHPAAAQAGDVLLVIIDIAQHDPEIPGPPAGWTQVTGSPFNLPSADRSFHVWAKTDSGAEPANYVFTFLGAVYNSGAIAAFRNSAAPGAFFFDAAFSSVAPSITVPPNSMAVVFGGNAGGNDTGAITNYTKQLDSNGPVVRTGLYTRSLPAGGATGTATASGATETLHLSVSAPDGTAHQLEVANAGKVIEMGSSAVSTVTIPPDATANLPVGSVVVVRRTGTGALTIVPAGGVTYNGPAAVISQHDEVWLHKRAVNVWHGSYVSGADIASQLELDAVVASLSAIGQVTPTDNYTLILTDAGKVVEMDKATAVNLTVPLNATVAFPIGTVIEIWQKGAGQVTVVATGGVTIRSTEGKLKLYGQYAGASLRKRGTDEWVLVGDLVA